MGLMEGDGAEKESRWKSQKLRETPGMKSQVYCTLKGMGAGVVVLVITCVPHSMHHLSWSQGIIISYGGVERRGDSFHLPFSPHFCACFLDSSPFRWGGARREDWQVEQFLCLGR